MRMRVLFSLLLLAATVLVVSAFTPITVPEVGTNSQEEWWEVKSGNGGSGAVGGSGNDNDGNGNGNSGGGGGNGRRNVGAWSMKIRRMEHPDDGTHPEIRQVRAANAATHKYRRLGIPGPEVDGALALRDVEDLLRKRGLLGRRQTNNDRVVTIGGGQTASVTSGLIPAATPRTQDSMGVGQDGNDLSYFSEVRFGSNNKPFILVIDTGSSDTWIPSDTCRSRACRVHATYGSRDSNTLVAGTRTFGIRYGSGQVEGTVVSDSISFAGFNMNISFGVATRVSDDFTFFPIDGIMGLGFRNASMQNVPTIMDELINNRLIEQKLFAIALARSTDAVNDGVVNFGAIDATLFEGQLNFMSSVSRQGLWEIKVDDTSIDGQGTGISGRTAIIDSGTSLILLPPDDARRLHSIIPGAETNGDAFAVPCNTTSNIEFTFGGVKYKVPPKDYVSERIKPDEDICQSLITGRQILGRSMWLLGDVFLKNVYSVFDLENGRVGFAPRRKADDPPPAPNPTGTSTTGTTNSPTGTPPPGRDAGTSGATTSRAGPAITRGPRVGNAAPFDIPASVAARGFSSASVFGMGISCLMAALVVGL